MDVQGLLGDQAWGKRQEYAKEGRDAVAQWIEQPFHAGQDIRFNSGRRRTPTVGWRYTKAVQVSRNEGRPDALASVFSVYVSCNVGHPFALSPNLVRLP